MLGELRTVQEETNVKKRQRKRRLLEILIEPFPKKIYHTDENTTGDTTQGLNPSCTPDPPGASTTTSNESLVICNELSGKPSPPLKTEDMESLEELLEGFTGVQQLSNDSSENQQYSSPQLKLRNHPADVEEESVILEEERYGDLLENLIASVSPDELLFKLSIGNEIPENFAPLDNEEQQIFATRGALNRLDSQELTKSPTDSETYDDLKEIIYQPNSLERSYLELDSTEQTTVALKDPNTANIQNSKSHKVDQPELKYSHIRNDSENGIVKLDGEECSWNNQIIKLEEKLYRFEAAAEKLEVDERLRLRESEEFTPDQAMVERRQLSVMLEDLLEEVDSLVCQKEPDGKKSRQSKQILNRRIQALAHANSCAIDEIGKIQQILHEEKPYYWKTDSEMDVNEVRPSKRQFKTSESPEVLCVKRQRADEGGPHIIQDSIENYPGAFNSMPRAGSGLKQKVITEEHETDGKIFHAPEYMPPAPAKSKDKVNSLSKEPEEPCTSAKMNVVGSEKSISIENQVELNDRVAVEKPTESSEKQDDQPINHTTPSMSVISKNIVTSNGLSLTIQFESQVLPMQKPTLELGRKCVEFEATKRNLEQNMEQMEEVRMEWRKAHRGSVNWARKLDVEAVLEQNSVQEVFSVEDELSKVSKPADNLPRRLFKKGPRPERERKCKRWLIDQDILKDLLEQSIPTASNTTSLGHQFTLGRRESEDCLDEDGYDEMSTMSPETLDVLGEELLQKLASPQDSQELSSNSSDTVSDFKDSDEEDDNEEQAQRTPNKDPPSQSLNMPMLDLL